MSVEEYESAIERGAFEDLYYTWSMKDGLYILSLSEADYKVYQLNVSAYNKFQGKLRVQEITFFS